MSTPKKGSQLMTKISEQLLEICKNANDEIDKFSDRELYKMFEDCEEFKREKDWTKKTAALIVGVSGLRISVERKELKYGSFSD